jgi:hypothetical protein
MKKKKPFCVKKWKKIKKTKLHVTWIIPRGGGALVNRGYEMDIFLLEV